MANITMTDPISEEQTPEVMKSLAVDFRYLLESAGVPIALMAKMASLEITTVEVFAKIVGSEAELKALLQSDMGFNPTGSIPNRVATAKLCNAWETANVRGKKRKEEESHQHVGDLPRKLPKADHYELRQTFQKRHRDFEDKFLPHPEWLEAKLQELEDGELKCEKLTEVISLADDAGGDGKLGFEAQADGTMKIKRSGVTRGVNPPEPRGVSPQDEAHRPHVGA